MTFPGKRQPEHCAADAAREPRDTRQADPEMFAAVFQPEGPEDTWAEVQYAFRLDESRRRYDVVVWHAAFAGNTQAKRLESAHLSLALLLGDDAVATWIGTVGVVTEFPDGAQPPRLLAAAVAELAKQRS